MVNKHNNPIILAILLLGIVLSVSCSTAKPAPKPVTPTATLVPPTATATKKPTSTSRPTATPNVAATKAYNDFFEQVKEYNNKGHISTLEGDYSVLDDFTESWAQLGWYRWWPQDQSISNFVYTGHFSWEAASQTPDITGCGIVFAIQPNKDHYAVFLDKSRILFLHALSTSRFSNEVGKTRGTGRVNITSPYSADFSIIVNGTHSYVYVNKAFVGEYTLSQDSVMEGPMGYTLFSGTNKDYGTKCEITKSTLWTFK